MTPLSSRVLGVLAIAAGITLFISNIQSDATPFEVVAASAICGLLVLYGVLKTLGK